MNQLPIWIRVSQVSKSLPFQCVGLIRRLLQSRGSQIFTKPVVNFPMAQGVEVVLQIVGGL